MSNGSRGGIPGPLDGTRKSREQAFAARVLAAREEERRRIARELHDDTSQALTSLMVGLETLQSVRDMASARTQAQTLATVAREALLGITRLIQGLRPAALERRDLIAALRAHAGQIEAIYGVEVEVQSTGATPPSLEPAAESSLYRMVQEAMTNAAKHALAEQINVTLHFRPASLRALIEDDGVGFDRAPSPEQPWDGVGLRSLDERTAALGAALNVESIPGEGTQVVIDLPLSGGSP